MAYFTLERSVGISQLPYVKEETPSTKPRKMIMTPEDLFDAIRSYFRLGKSAPPELYEAWALANANERSNQGTD